MCPSASPSPLTNLPPVAWAGHAVGRPLVFLHIPKTAGTAVASVLTQWFDVDDIMPWDLGTVRRGNHPSHTLAARCYKLFGIGMHYDHDHVASIRHALRDGASPPFVVTVLREPRARLISQYLHWRRTDDASLQGQGVAAREVYLAARELSIGDFLNTKHPLIIEHFRNYQTRLLAGLASTRLAADEEILATARANVAGYDLVGTTSQLDEVIGLVATAYGVTPPGTLQSLNVAPSRAPQALDEATDAVLSEYTALDDEIWRDLQGERRPAPQRKATCFFEVDRGIRASLVGAGFTRFSMREPLDGTGWHVREGEFSEVRWTGPGRRSVVRLAAPRSRRITASIQVICAIDWSMVEGLNLTLDGMPPVATPDRGEHGGYPTIRAEFMLPDASCNRRELVIEVPYTRSHSELNSDWDDPRQKGLAVGEIVLSVSEAASPATLGDIFWSGQSWSGHPSSELASLLTVSPSRTPLPTAACGLTRDLALVRSLFDLIGPQHVYSPAANGVLASLARGTPARSREGRLAIVSTPREMIDNGARTASFAARHAEAVLVLAMAEDPRLRALALNPSLIPHLHMVGCDHGLLIANLGGMNRDAGNKFVEEFLWLLERVGSTAPESLGTRATPMDSMHADLQLRLVVAAVVAANEAIPAAQWQSAVLATLLPEDQQPPPLASLAESLARLRSQAQAPIVLVDPELLDSLARSLATVLASDPDAGRAASPPMLEAHRTAFQILGMLSGWRQWGLETNSTATLAANMAAAMAATRLLTDDQRRLAARALRIDMNAGLGTIQPKPLKPQQEYLDATRLTAAILRRQIDDAAASSDATTPVTAVDHPSRLSRTVREVEDALGLLGQQFPDEEILWVDAGCGNGTLLCMVEPPPNIRGRCRFVGVDSCDPSIAVARTAVAAAGRLSCQFEVGDIATLQPPVGGSRIHLITAFDVLEQCEDPLVVLRQFRALKPGYLMVSPALSAPQGVLASAEHRWCWDAAGLVRMAEESDLMAVNVAPRATGDGPGLPLYFTPRLSRPRLTSPTSESVSRQAVSRQAVSRPAVLQPLASPPVSPVVHHHSPAAHTASRAPVPAGAASMIAAVPSPRLSDAEFFSKHYHRLSGWLNAFAHARHRATKSADSASALAELVALSNRIAAEGLTIVSGTPAGGESASVREFFGIAARLRDELRQSPIAAHVAAGDELEKHLDYFHHNIPDAALDTAIQSEPASIYVRECVANCIHVLTDRVFNGYQWSCPDPRKVTDFFDTTVAEAEITPAARTLMTAVTALEGWCSPQKSLLLYSLARAHKPQTVVEIGIYGGRSIVPIAAALKDNGIGQVYGIETWSGSAAVSYRTNIANDFWWQNIDFPKLKGDFLQFVVQHQLQDTIRVIESASDRCGGLFDRIDMLHIDGGHSTYGAAQDVVNYVSKVPSGGIIIYDDINWPSTAAGLEILRDSCRLIHVVPAFGSETEPGCAAFVKI